MTCFTLIVFFFFQAEDGIRDKLVTGVQTCALPISLRPAPPRARLARARYGRRWRGGWLPGRGAGGTRPDEVTRALGPHPSPHTSRTSLDARTRIGRRRAAAVTPDTPAAPGRRHLAFPPPRAADAGPRAGRLGATGTTLLAAARRLHDPRHAGHGAPLAPRRRDDPLREQLPRHAALRLATARPEPLRRRQPGRGAEPAGHAVRGRRLRGRVHDRLRQGGQADG